MISSCPPPIPPFLFGALSHFLFLCILAPILSLEVPAASNRLAQRREAQPFIIIISSRITLTAPKHEKEASACFSQKEILSFRKIRYLQSSLLPGCAVLISGADADPLDGRDEDDFDSRSIKTRLKQRQRRENSCKISPEEYEFDFSASSERKEGQLLLALLERLKRKRICEYVTQQKVSLVFLPNKRHVLLTSLSSKSVGERGLLMPPGRLQ